jgi:hypothetical protein
MKTRAGFLAAALVVNLVLAGTLNPEEADAFSCVGVTQRPVGIMKL